jgi:glycosyltransferase involved in cell wall biosynthesis
MISVLILTLDEEINISDCIASLPWRSDVHVLDSGSSDQTEPLARALDAKFVVRPFTNYAEQRNAGLALPFAHDWILMIDADERVTPALAAEIETRIKTAEADLGMLRVRRKDMFMGRWLRRSSGYPTWFPRLMRRGMVTVEREINEVYRCSGRTDELREHLVHYPFNKGMDWWYERHSRYATAEAEKLLGEERNARLRLGQLIARDPGVRRAALKRVAYRLPGRPFLTFLYLYVLRLGFLDGAPGYHYATMRMAYEVMIDSKSAFSRQQDQSQAHLTAPPPRS